MKYRIMYIANWIDENILVHGERFERIPLLWRIPSCQWVGRLEIWADENEDEDEDEGQGSFELLEEAYLVRFDDNDS